MKHTIIFLAIIIAVVGFSLGGYKLLPQYKPPQAENPFIEFQSLEDACTYAEFALTPPENYGNVSEKVFRVLRAEKKIRRLIEVIYLDAEKNEIIRFRKSFGKGDISGDSSRYTANEDAKVGSRAVRIKGTSDGFYNAIWSVIVIEAGEESQFAYSVMSQTPLTRTEMISLIESIS